MPTVYMPMPKKAAVESAMYRVGPENSAQDVASTVYMAMVIPIESQ